VPPIGGNVVCAELDSTFHETTRQNENVMIILFVLLEWEKVQAEDEMENMIDDR